MKRLILNEVTNFSSGRRVKNLLLYGSNGIGKTTLAKQVLKELENVPRVKCVYSNCWCYYTQMGVYSLIARELGEAIPRRGLATDEVFDRLLQVLEKTNQKVVIVLDEIDGLLFNNQQKLLYKLAKAERFFLTVSICNDEKGFTELDSKLKLPLRLKELLVNRFEKQELIEILDLKVSKAFATNAVSKEVVNYCADKMVELNGNITQILEALCETALLAESQGKNAVSLEDLKQVLQSPQPLQTKKSFLSSEEKIILSILLNGSLPSTFLYEKFCEKLKRSKRHIRNYLKTLEQKQLVKIIDDFASPRHYKRKIVSLA